MADADDIAVDFMDMTNDRRLWVLAEDARTGFVVEVGRYAVVGDDDADPKVARIVEISSDGNPPRGAPRPGGSADVLARA